MTWYPHVTVASTIEKDGRFLLVYENSDGERVYNQPAGHLERDETIIEAATRETLEETAWHSEPQKLLGVRHYVSPHNGVCYIRFSFVSTALRHEAELSLDTDIIDALWLSFDEILERRDEMRSPLVIQDIEQYRRGEFHPLSIIGAFP